MPDNKAAYLKYQRLLQIQRLMAQSELEGPKIKSQIDANRLRGRASGASAARSLFPILKESGGGTLPEGLEDFQGIMDPAASAANTRIKGNYERKGRLDESLIGNRGAQKKSAEALTNWRNVRTQNEPAESRSRVARNNSSAAFNHIRGSLLQQGHDEGQVKEAISAVMQHHLDEAENMTARGAGKPPATPGWDQIYKEAQQYLTDKRSATAVMSGKSRELNPGQSFSIDGGNRGFGRIDPSSIQPNSPGSIGDEGMSEDFMALLSQPDDSLDLEQYDEGEEPPDDPPAVPYGTGMGSYNGPDPSYQDMRTKQMINDILRQQGIIR